MACLAATLKEIKNLINNQTFLMDDPEKGDPVIACTDVYKENIQSDGIFEKVRLRIVARGDM